MILFSILHLFSISASKLSHQRICRSCGIWKLASDDVYCSFCGERVAKLEVRLSDNIAYFGDHGARAEFAISMINQGQTDIYIEEISTDYDWVKIKAENKIPCKINTGDKLDVPVIVDLNENEGYYKNNIHLVSNAGNWDQSIYVLPKPRVLFNIEKTSISVELKTTTSEEPLSNQEKGFIIRPANVNRERWKCKLEIRNSTITIESLNISLKSEGDISSTVIEIQTPELPYTIDAGNIREFYFMIDIDISRLPYDEELEFEISVKCLRIPEPIKGRFILIRKLEPKIDFIRASGENLVISDDLLVRQENEVKDVSIEIVNSGGLKVELMSASIDEEWIEPGFTLPRVLDPGRIDKLNLHMKIGRFMKDLENIYPSSIKANFALLLKFRCIDYPEFVIPDKKINIIANIAMMPEYDGIVAIDFGTTNSCCAIENQSYTHQSEMVPLSDLPKTDDSALLPSVIYYINKNDDKFEYIVGERALTFSLFPDTSPSTVRSIKRRLGQRESIPVILDESKQQVELLPEDISSHIIREIINTTEEYIKRRIKRVVVTHPARFFRPQIKALESAFTKCGLEIVALVNEAVASALDAILEQKIDKPQYTILVYDFGGGTTDIALLRVRDSINDEGLREIVPETLGVDGKRRLGGDDVTEKIAQLIKKKCNDELKRSENLELIWIENDDEVTDERLRNASNTNKVNIKNAAEELKKRVATTGEVCRENLNLICRQDGEIKIYSFDAELSEKEINELVKEDIKDAMNLANNLVKMANERDNLSISYPDIVILSGMSSKLPIVRKIAEEIFPNSEVRLHPDPKACVARGAYLIHAMSEWPAMVTVDTSLLKSPPPTSAQYGIMVYGIHGEPIFKSAIKKGAKLPSEGIIGGFRIGKKTSITVYENPGKNISDPEIRKIAVCRLDIPESVSNQELKNAEVFMKLEDEMKLKIIIKVGEKEFNFDAEVEPYL
ncbi:MAG: Hsp70 family protein [bacterium]